LRMGTTLCIDIPYIIIVQISLCAPFFTGMNNPKDWLFIEYE
jgi:hypothetical protein